MKKRIIRIVDSIVNLIVIVCFLPMLLYSIYVIWDASQIYQGAASTVYEMYKPGDKEELSFDELKKINPEVFGWLTVEDTQIDYPLVQSSNNSKYVNTDIEGKFSLSGSIFLDCRNKNNFADMNNIIYGHHMQKDAMFGELEKFAQRDFFNNHKYGKIFYEDKWHKIVFFAFVEADAYDDIIYNPLLKNCDEYLDYIRECATHFQDLSFLKEEHFISLSTCTTASTNGRHILIGRIIE